jgi:cell filamentation protein
LRASGSRRRKPAPPRARRTAEPDFSSEGRTEPRDTLLGPLSHEQLKPLIAEGVALGYTYLFDLVASDAPPEISLGLIQELHRRAFGHIYDWAGKWRAIELEWPPPEVVSPPWSITTDLRNLCDDLEYRLASLPERGDPSLQAEVVDLVAWFQHRFVKIHPFRDFNGRMARLLTSYLLLQLGFPALEIDAEEGEGRTRYIAAMKAADQFDLGPLSRLIATALSEAMAQDATSPDPGET